MQADRPKNKKRDATKGLFERLRPLLAALGALGALAELGFAALMLLPGPQRLTRAEP
jgi:hypothetical protein